MDSGEANGPDQAMETSGRDARNGAEVGGGSGGGSARASDSEPPVLFRVCGSTDKAVGEAAGALRRIVAGERIKDVVATMSREHSGPRLTRSSAGSADSRSRTAPDEGDKTRKSPKPVRRELKILKGSKRQGGKSLKKDGGDSTSREKVRNDKRSDRGNSALIVNASDAVAAAMS